MVAIVPNQYHVEGTVLAKRQDPNSDDHFLVDLSLHSVKVIQGPREFLESGVEKITICVSKKEAQEIKEGRKMECMVKRTRQNFLALEDSISL